MNTSVTRLNVHHIIMPSMERVFASNQQYPSSWRIVVTKNELCSIENRAHFRYRLVTIVLSHLRMSLVPLKVQLMVLLRYINLILIIKDQSMVCYPVQLQAVDNDVKQSHSINLFPIQVFVYWSVKWSFLTLI